MIERFSASVAAKQMACHASANLEVAIPNWTPPEIDETPAAAAGTSVHSILEKVWELSAGDLHAFARIVQYVADLRSTRRFKVLIEQTVEATWLATKPKTTADLVLYTQDEIHVIDTKWGKIPVEVIENDQLLYYDVCYAPLAPKAKGVTNHILQPRANIMESWFADTNRIAQFMKDAIATENAIQNGSVTFGPSDHCKFCPANPHSRGVKGKPMCPAMMQMLYPAPLNEDEILSL
jgi:hypothetical protein